MGIGLLVKVNSAPRRRGMATGTLPPAPPGYRYIFRPWRKCAHTGKVLYAKAFGLKAWPILIPV